MKISSSLNRRIKVDETGLKGLFYVDMKWKVNSEAERFQPEPDAVIAAARERLGLQLAPAQRPVEILEVSKASH